MLYWDASTPAAPPGLLGGVTGAGPPASIRGRTLLGPGSLMRASISVAVLGQGQRAKEPRGVDPRREAIVMSCMILGDVAVLSAGGGGFRFMVAVTRARLREAITLEADLPRDEAVELVDSILEMTSDRLAAGEDNPRSTNSWASAAAFNSV